MKFKVELEGCDYIEVECEESDSSAPHIPGAMKKVVMLGCSEMIEMMQKMKTNFGHDLKKWPIPVANDHGSMLLREMILKLRGEWTFPYAHAELCHCRSVPAQVVDQVVIAGAHSTEKVTRLTSASSACGTCRPDVQKIIDYRLDKKTS